MFGGLCKFGLPKSMEERYGGSGKGEGIEGVMVHIEMDKYDRQHALMKL